MKLTKLILLTKYRNRMVMNLKEFCNSRNAEVEFSKNSFVCTPLSRHFLSEKFVQYLPEKVKKTYRYNCNSFYSPC